MPEIESAENYRQRAAEMKSQAQRAETVYLQALYASIADNWDRLAAQMQAVDRADRQKRSDALEEAGDEDDPSPPPAQQARNSGKPASLS